jgi:protoporphyrinogen oxidase
MNRVAILGGGLTGLSAAYHLRDGYEMFEQESEAGGLCRTMPRDGFLFDYTGHLLHLRQDYTKQLLQQLLPDHYHLLTRKAFIYTHGRYIPYPFQANIASLPPEVIKDCMLGFFNTLLDAQRHEQRDSSVPYSFQQWVLETFGTGIASHFMLPYNQKLWKISLDEMSADWVAGFVPKPTLEEFLNGALGIQNPDFGYNPTFFYPKTGGADQLPNAFLAHLQPERVHYRKKAVEIDVEGRTIRFADGSTYHYETLIATMPLKYLAAMIRNVPAQVARAAEQLRYISVYDVNIGVNRPNISDKHWLYFPEPEFIFYRVGFPSNFSASVAPAGYSSMYVEVSVFPEEEIDEQILVDRISEGLQHCGVLKAADEIVVCDVVRIECAYVLYDLNRAQALQTILPYLQQQHIYAIGRYGSWVYSAMEDAILAGKQIAETIGIG